MTQVESDNITKSMTQVEKSMEESDIRNQRKCDNLDNLDVSEWKVWILYTSVRFASAFFYLQYIPISITEGVSFFGEFFFHCQILPGLFFRGFHREAKCWKKLSNWLKNTENRLLSLVKVYSIPSRNHTVYDTYFSWHCPFLCNPKICFLII